MENNQSDINYGKKPIQPRINKSKGLTSSEQRLCELGYRTFLSLWSYPNLFLKHKQVKELCDLLVVFENHIIIFSDKNCKFGNSGNIKTDWLRWYKKSIIASVRQLEGAKSWITNHPDRICLDCKGEVDFPLKIEVNENTVFHLVAIAHGASAKCKEYFGGNDGGFIITNNTTFDINNLDTIEPFNLGMITTKDGTFVHVLDDSSYELVLKELDTIRDFIDYLSDKEKLFLSDVLVCSTGEKEILSQHVEGLIIGDNSALCSLRKNYPDINHISFEEELWEELICSSKYLKWKEQLKNSYFIDELMNKTFTFIESGEALSTTPSLESQSELFKYLVRDDRYHRAALAHSILSFVKNNPDNFRGTRVVYRKNDPSICYVIFLLPRFSYMKEEEYRRIRADMLRDYCLMQKVKFPEVKMVIGIAHESNDSYMSSEDFLALDTSVWSDNDQNTALKLIDEYKENNLLCEQQMIDVSYNRVEKPTVIKIKGRDRNKPCPCGSGKKYKKCCGRFS